jgi:site-specific recombinase XerD
MTNHSRKMYRFAPAATEILRDGVPLDKIGFVLRHRSTDTTAYYAKVDFALLQQVAQPWPEVNL